MPAVLALVASLAAASIVGSPAAASTAAASTATAYGETVEAAKTDRSQAVRLAEAMLAGRCKIGPYDPVTLDWPLIWRENPLRRSTWLFNYHTLRWVRPLAIAYRETGDRRYRRRYAEILHSHAAANPYGRAVTTWAWNDNATAYRAMAYADATRCWGGRSGCALRSVTTAR